MKKKLLFVMSRTPYGNSYVQETIDVIMTAAAFDQQVELLFVDNGVFQLKKDHHPDPSGQKNIPTLIQALPVYEINQFYVESESLQERGLAKADLQLSVETIPRSEIDKLFASYHMVYSS